MNFGDRLKNLREERGFGINQLAVKSGVSASQISRFESGKRNAPTIETVKKLATALSVSIDQLTGEKKEPYYNLSEKEVLDIGELADKMMEGLTNESDVSFYGEPMTDEEKEQMRTVIELGLRMNKEKAKKKFTPNKFRDGEG